MIDKVFHARF